MLAIFRELEASGQELIVTDRDVPVLRIVPIKTGNTVAELFGHLQGQVAYLKDNDKPTLDEWGES